MKAEIKIPENWCYSTEGGPVTLDFLAEFVLKLKWDDDSDKVGLTTPDLWANIRSQVGAGKRKVGVRGQEVIFYNDGPVIVFEVGGQKYVCGHIIAVPWCEAGVIRFVDLNGRSWGSGIMVNVESADDVRN